MAATRQWRLMINGELVDVENEDGARAEPQRRQPARRRWSLGQAAYGAVAVIGVAVEIGLSVYCLARFGFSWHVALLGLFAYLAFILGMRLVR